MMHMAQYHFNVILVYGGFMLLPSDPVSGTAAMILGWWLSLLGYLVEEHDE
jgi:hypothetical protein